MNNETKTKQDFSLWICERCIHYPPSSRDGKPCCICDPEDPLLNCYCERED